ncbi:uncharacterized protein EURHEDRAFT_206374 [Aspergillus ruber CBS 135680]|uniref:Uncharacterized protein n=1 Tax=Aspergillus ruber (strain CBS 135680) TaxID=1388766 RepID=A0A017SNW9_ASPRC|nr:uncharacterized protein EURHEDRAFT_206374 [Aspergillus ruber CBS 135680]EYE98324.1 hypothetical protein EURHEDRAFT_206374 [Aspergillus ruber CBS 135680]
MHSYIVIQLSQVLRSSHLSLQFCSYPRHAPAAITGDSNTCMSLVLVAIMSHIVLLATSASCVSVDHHA